MNKHSRKLKTAILGSGNIGTDLLIKILRSPYLSCSVFLGRNLSSAGMSKAQALGVPVSSESIQYLQKNPECCDIVFDATSAKAHHEHAPILKSLNKFVIDLTPAKIGSMCVPVVNIDKCLKSHNINMVTCGGQASVPLVHAISKIHHDIEYIEVVSSIASRSAGPATRFNIDEYIHTTEKALQQFSGTRHTKAILNLNPAQPCINMQTTVFAKVNNPNIPELRKVVQEIVMRVKKYVPGYELLLEPILENNRIIIMVRVKGLGDYLPEYAGNLDIINCAALAVSEEYAKEKLYEKSVN
jgi:acetaldehyde dehydrogenase (acetylating)